MDTFLLLGLLGPPLTGAAVALTPRSRARGGAYFNAVTMLLSLGCAGVIALHLATSGTPLIVGDAWRLDALSALLALLISSLATLAAWIGPGVGRASTPLHEIRTYRIYANLFSLTMLIAVSTSNLGVMWVAIEATTVTSALLIPLRRTKAAVEASWKYLLIGSVGIALAFTGTVLAFVDYATTGGDMDLALHWTVLRAAAPALHPEVARLAFVFLLVGFGTKAGLVPTHTWLPDAHSEAPAPLSAMMSGVLLAVALYAIARWKSIIDVAVGSSFSDTLLLVVGVATVAIGSVSLLSQTHYKRVLAYSSIEHMGLACLGLALGPLGTFAALLHLTCHALAKSTAFFLSGRVFERYASGSIANVPGLLGTVPLTAVLFAGGVLALAGLPPFGLFMSEVLIVRATWAAGHGVVTSAVLVLMLAAFVSLMVHLQRMMLGKSSPAVQRGERSSVPLVLLSLPMVMLAWIGIALPTPLYVLLTRAAAVIRP